MRKKQFVLSFFVIVVISVLAGFWFKIPTEDFSISLLNIDSEWKKEMILKSLENETLFFGEKFRFNWRLSVEVFVILIVGVVIYQKIKKRYNLK